MPTPKSASSAPQKPAKTSTLPPAYEAASVEDRLYKAWEKSGFFNPDKLPGGKKKKPFTIVMPPPNATGTLHVGHATMLAIEDAFIRFQRMLGKAALWIPGTDHASIATQAKVEKIIAAEEQKTRHDLGREAFLKRVETFVKGSQSTIRNQVRKMGSSCDWSREAYTLDASRSAAVKEMFVRMYNDGLMYRGERIVNWCPRCASTLADDEVEYKEEQATLYFMKYGPFVVATTRPETKLGDTAVAVHPDDPRYKKWIGQDFTVDFGIGEQRIRVIADKEIDPKFGTGVLGVTPAHSAIDWAMAEKNNLPWIKVIGEDGNMTDRAGKYAGLSVLEARAKFVADLRAQGLIEKEETITHNLSVCYRCGTTVEPLPSLQWFVDVNKKIPGRSKSLKQLAIGAVKSGETQILPDRFEKVYYHWMENLRDWCVSRQLWFGHRIPAWYCDDCKNIFVASTGPTQKTKCSNCQGTSWTQDADTFDTWFSSGTWTFSTLGWPNKTADLKRFHPTDVLETGHDIIFFWVARMILMTEYAMKTVPFKRVYLHGLVRDEQGRKMSKSLGNVIDPLDVIPKFGTDALRLALTLGSTPGNDSRMSEEKIASFRNFTNKLWNLARFVAMSAGGKNGRLAVPTQRPTPKTLADKWILGRLDEVTKSVTTDLESLNVSRPGETLRDFTWADFADWYVEIAKHEGGKEKILACVLHNLLRLWHPFMPFVTEELYQKLFAKSTKDFLMLASWPKAKGKLAPAIAKDFAAIQELVTALRNLRSTYKVAPSQAIDAVIAAGPKLAFIKKNIAAIAGLARLSKVEVSKTAPRVDGAVSVAAAGVTVEIPLAGLVDLEAEAVRLDKEIHDLAKYIDNLDGRLSNSDFASRAPANIVAAEREKLNASRHKLEQLKEQRKALPKK